MRNAGLPPDDPQRVELHDEVHARPPMQLPLPALVVYVAVLHDGIGREAQWAHLQRLPGQENLPAGAVSANFLRLEAQGYALQWERHTEFSRYSVVQPLAPDASLGLDPAQLLDTLPIDAAWLREVPGRTIAAVTMLMHVAALDEPESALDTARRAFGDSPVVASLMGQGHALAVTDFRLGDSGFERFLVLAAPDTRPSRAGRISQRLLEIETYRMMALRGLPVAKRLGPELSRAEAALADITARLEAKRDDDQALLDDLIAQAASVERATAEHVYRFAATQAYARLVDQRIAELRERPVPGTQTIGEFMQRRLSPAIATVAATGERLAALAQRIERTGALLRTRVDIATETQNQQLLERLTRGQALQLQLQSTVEGLSIAAISYYVVSLILYLAKAGKAAGLPLNPELAAGASIPLVLWGVAALVRRIHRRLHA